MSITLHEQIHVLYAAYAEDRFDFLLNDWIDDDISWESCAPTQIFPFFGRGRGKEALLAAWNASRVQLEFLSYMPMSIVAEADAAAVIVQMRIRQRGTNRVLSLMVADFLRLRSGRIVKFRQFMDTLDATEQFLGRDLVLPAS